MKSSLREEIIEHNAKELFDIVLDIESYPYFIPWCSAMKVHSKNDKDPYVSKDFGILKYSVPEFILNNKVLMNLISEIKVATIEDGGEGAFYIFLKKKK